MAQALFVTINVFTRVRQWECIHVWKQHLAYIVYIYVSTRKCIQRKQNRLARQPSKQKQRESTRSGERERVRNADTAQAYLFRVSVFCAWPRRDLGGTPESQINWGENMDSFSWLTEPST